MVKVTREEAFAIRKLFGDSVCVSMTMVQRPKRHKFYVPEERRVLDFLERFNKEKIVEHFE